MGEAALILEQISRTELWQQTHPSFTAWVKSLAERSGYQESNIWRMITAARFYVGLGGEFGAIKLPPLSEISSIVTAEQLELIEKISRKAPSDEIEKLLTNVLTKSLTRDRLRLLWRIFRDCDSKTVDSNSLDTKLLPPGQLSEIYRSPIKVGKRTTDRASTLISLLDADPAWTGVIRPHLYRPIYTPPVSLVYEENGKLFKYVPDCLIVTQEKRGGAVFFHIIEMIPVRSIASINIRNKFKAVVDYCDYFWLALDMSPTENQISGLSENIGIILSDGNSLVVHRKPKLSVGSENKTGNLSKLLLAEIL